MKILRATRCAQGRVIERPDDALAGAGALSPVKARIALMLDLFDGGLRRRASSRGTAAPACRQLDSASNARAVISSTVPVPLMARYLGALTGSALAQLE